MSLSTTTSAPATSTTGSAAVLAGRVLLSVLFIAAGFGKLTAISGTAQWFGSMGLPAPTVVAVLVGLLEFFGGLAVLVGFYSRAAAIALAVFTIAASLLAHTDFSDMTQTLFFQKNLGIAGGFLLLAVFGPGAYAINRR
ncbi:MAG: DoxX family protein [Rhizobiaceae bacterium]|nr:DoxX family protein [Rhizobiaceae bacterium]